MTTDQRKNNYSANLKILDKQRVDLETECSAIVNELTSSPGPDIQPIGINTPLVDADGYPRADIDLYHARELRKRYAEIQQDYKSIMGRIEQGLSSCGDNKSNNEEDRKAREKKPKPKFDPVSKKWVVRNSDGSVAGIENGHLQSFDNIGKLTEQQQRQQTASVNAVGTGVSISQVKSKQEEEREKQLPPFAIINEVSTGSPAEKAGLRVGDLILRFGTVIHSNPNFMHAIAGMVPEASLENGHIPILVLRSKDEHADVKDIVNVDVSRSNQWVTVRMKFYPKLWAGRGLLGCHLQQI